MVFTTREKQSDLQGSAWRWIKFGVGFGDLHKTKRGKIDREEQLLFYNSAITSKTCVGQWADGEGRFGNPDMEEDDSKDEYYHKVEQDGKTIKKEGADRVQMHFEEIGA